jgi:CHASE3 domain sensor protein
MNNAYKQKLEFKISHAESNLRYLILNDPDNAERIEDIKKEIQRCKNELQDYITLPNTPTPQQ